MCRRHGDHKKMLARKGNTMSYVVIIRYVHAYIYIYMYIYTYIEG